MNNVLEKAPNLPALSGRNGWQSLWFCLGLAGLAMAAFLSLRTSPALSTLNWIPVPISHWADVHGRFDNFPAYGMVGIPFYLITHGYRRQVGVMAMLILFVVVLEIAQLAIPTRHCDMWDIFWGSLGLIAAWVICEAFHWLRGGFRPGSTPSLAP